MKALHTEDYFKQYKNYLFERYKKDCDFEHDLEIMLPDLSELPEYMRERAMAIIRKDRAERVAAVAKEKLLKKMRMIQAIRDGKAALGYTSQMQEVREWHDLNEGFEFSCYMLAEFKRKYGIA